MPPQAVKRVGSRRAVFGSCKQEFKEIWGVIWDEMEEKEATPDPSPTIERVCDAKYILGLNLKFAPPTLISLPELRNLLLEGFGVRSQHPP